MLWSGAILGILTCFAGAPDEGLVQTVIRKFQEDFHRPDARDDDRIAAVACLAQNRHERVVKVLAPLLTEGSVQVRMIAARSLGKFAGIESAGRELLEALRSAANSGKQLTPVRIEILRALGALAYKPAAGAIAPLIVDKEVWVSKAAIDASAKIRFEEAIPLLIRVLARIEGHGGDGDLSVNPFDGILEGLDSTSLWKPDPHLVRRPKQRDLLRGPLQAALESITKESLGSAKDWEKWWLKHKTDFKIVR